jgi:hypothetical protein
MPIKPNHSSDRNIYLKVRPKACQPSKFTAGVLAYLGGDSFSFGQEQRVPSYGFENQTSDRLRGLLPSEIE